VSLAVSAREADGELAAGAGADDDAPAGAEAAELPGDPHAAASNARQATAPKAAAWRILGEQVISMSSNFL
jgi:hypothetical protein